MKDFARSRSLPTVPKSCSLFRFFAPHPPASWLPYVYASLLARRSTGGHAMIRWVAAALIVAVVCTAPLAAADATAKPVGTWTKKEGDATVTFQIKADALTIKVVVADKKSTTGDRKYDATAEYSSKDGVLSGSISKHASYGIEGTPGAGDKFSFRYKVEKGKLVISELKSAKASDEAKKLVEGPYEKQKEDKEEK